MSTVDPAEARRRRNGDGPGRERLARRAVGCYLAGAVASVILGVGVALLFDTLRSSTIMPIDDEPAAIFWVPGTLVVGIAGAFLLGYASELARRSRGRMESSGLGLFLGIAAVTVGVVIAVLAWWSRPPTVGRTPDPFGDEPRDWGFGSWLLYTASWWLPVLLALVAVACLLAWRRTEARVAASAALRDSLLVHGARTTGVVTDARVLISTNGEGNRSVSGAIGTVRFTAGGVDRWVERRTRAAASSAIVMLTSRWRCSCSRRRAASACAALSCRSFSSLACSSSLMRSSFSRAA